MVCDCPTMPKRGVVISTTRRSRSLARPVISACTGAEKPREVASVGTSCTRPSVTTMAPATRSWGTSERLVVRALNSRVPSVSPSDWAAALPGGLAGPQKAPHAAGYLAEPLRELGAHRFGLPRALPEFLARALVDHHHGDGGQRIAVLARDGRIGERQHEQRHRDNAHP